jgi:fumarate reductase subunit D
MARSNEPLWWTPFSAGLMVGALFVPVLIVITALVARMRPDAAGHFQGLVNFWLTRLLLVVVIVLSFFHAAHRFRYVLFDLGLKGGREVVAFACYGAAIVGSFVVLAIAAGLL